MKLKIKLSYISMSVSKKDKRVAAKNELHKYLNAQDDSAIANILQKYIMTTNSYDEECETVSKQLADDLEHLDEGPERLLNVITGFQKLPKIESELIFELESDINLDKQLLSMLTEDNYKKLLQNDINNCVTFIQDIRNAEKKRIENEARFLEFLNAINSM